MRVLLIDNYDSFTYNLAQYLGELGAEVSVLRNDAVTVNDLDRDPPDAIVISPGPCTPNEAGVSLEVIRAFSGRLPLLGVCLGHQAIGQAFGGRVVRAPEVMHGKTSRVFHDEKGLFAGLPNPFQATRYHSLVIEPETCPDILEVTARTWEGVIMGVRHKRHAGSAAPLEGLQFHPESIMTPEGKRMLGNFLAMAAPRPVADGDE
jgi:anthranilate synthase/aminodeoxychorismate synthase-like glutamine amidotransferase